MIELPSENIIPIPEDEEITHDPTIFAAVATVMIPNSYPEIQEQIRHLTRNANAAAGSRFTIGKITYFWDKALMGLGAMAIAAPLLQAMAQVLTQTDQATETKKSKRKRTYLCLINALKILEAGRESVEEVMRFRKLERSRYDKRNQKRYKGRL